MELFRHLTFIPLLLAAGMMGLVSGCRPPATHQALEVTDSAGVRIVVAHDSLRAEHFPAVRLLEMVDTIGVGVGDEPYQFSYLRGAVLTSGGILVGDQLSREIRYFDGRGRFLASLGREGEGPGEFANLSWIQRGPDGILVLPDVAVGLESVWLGSGVNREIRNVDLDGRVRVILRLPSQGLVTDDALPGSLSRT